MQLKCYFRSYFQFNDFPSLSQLIIFVIRLAVVSFCLAWVIHSMYSLRWLLLRASKVAWALGCFFNSVLICGGTFTGAASARLGRGDFIPSAFSFIACLMCRVRMESLGRSARLVIFPSWPMDVFGLGWAIESRTSLCQKLKAQCSLNAAMLQSMP